MTKSALAIFEDFKIRRQYDEKMETWYFSIVDVIYALTQSNNPRKYWSVLKTRLKNEGNQTATNCSQLKFTAEDGKMRLTDVANPEQLLRLIQSIPSPKAEPFKMWLAKVGYERIQETANPSKALDHAQPLGSTRTQPKVDTTAHDGPENPQQADRLLASAWRNQIR